MITLIAWLFFAAGTFLGFAIGLTFKHAFGGLVVGATVTGAVVYALWAIVTGC